MTRVVLAHSGDARRLSGQCGPGTRWIYADGDTVVYQRISDAMELARYERLVTPEEFCAAAAGLRHAFVEWIDRNLGASASGDWMTAPLAKNPFASNGFLHAVWLSILERTADEEVVVFTDSAGFGKTIIDQCRRLGRRCIAIGRPRKVLSQTRAWLRSFLRLVIDASELSCRIVLANAILGDAHRRRLRGTRVLIDTYLHEGDLDEAGRFCDRYWPGLEAYYQAQRIKVATFVVPMQRPFVGLFRTLRLIKASASHLVPLELFVSLGDIARGVSHVWRMSGRRPENLEEFASASLEACVAEWRRKAWSHGLRAWLMAEFPRHLAANGVEPQLVLDWCENQATDFALVVGFGAIGQRSSVVGVRQYTLIPNWLSMFTTSHEIEAGVAASDQWACGRAQRLAAARFDPMGRYSIAPALRYQHLHQPKRNPSEKAPDQVLVLLTHSAGESLRIVQCVAEAAATNKLERVRIKAHGDLSARTLASFRAMLAPLKEAVTWDSRPVGILIHEARVVVSGGSSAAVEAACQGVPVILVGSTAGLTMNPLEEFDSRLWRLVFCGSQLATELANWPATLAHDTRSGLAAAIRSDQFEAASPRTMASFMEPLSRQGASPTLTPSWSVFGA